MSVLVPSWIKRRMSWEERLARHLATVGARPIEKVVIEGHDVILADGGPHHDSSEFPNGYWATAFCIERGREWHVQDLYFDFNHNPELPTREAKLSARLTAAKHKAEEQLKIGKQGRLYE